MRDQYYFISDVHLGLQVLDPQDRERRFTAFLENIPAERTQAIYLLGDIWDFWYEWKYTVPKGYVRVFAALIGLMDRGVEIYFFQGNHDVWSYSYFEELGMKRLTQPAFIDIEGKVFCLGHGDALGKTPLNYRIMRSIFHNRAAQWAFSTFIHPTLAMAIGNAWSRNNRLKRAPYVWKGEEEPLWQYSKQILQQRSVDYFIFGHFHVAANDIVFAKDGEKTRTARLVILDSWLYNDAPFVYSTGKETI